MMKLSPSYILSALFGVLFFYSGLVGANRVFVKAESLDEYLIERSRDGSKKMQSFQFMKGQYHPGRWMDPSMEKVTFEELVYDLAVQLRKQDFYPIPELGKSDLLIVVHYGATGSRENFNSSDPVHDINFGYSDGVTEYTRRSPYEGMSAMELYHVRDNSYRSRLLGMDFNKTWASDKRLLSILSSESRYFVILNAYDFQLLQQGEVNLLWRTRYNVRALGQSFEVALKDMNRIASDYMGKNIKGFIQKRVDDSSHVSFGDIEVIGGESIEEENRDLNYLNYDLPSVPQDVRTPLPNN